MTCGQISQYSDKGSVAYVYT